VQKENTILIDGAGAPKAIEARIKNIRIQIEEATSDYDKEELQERVAKLAGGIAAIKVGAATEVEIKEKNARVEDALHATRGRWRRHARRHRRDGRHGYVIPANAAFEKPRFGGAFRLCTRKRGGGLLHSGSNTVGPHDRPHKEGVA
jgi:hypothetical protein